MTINEQLDENIPRGVISTRTQSGKSLSYLETWYVIDRLNQVLGTGNWSWEVKSMTPIQGEKISYVCHGMLSMNVSNNQDKYSGWSSKDGIGYGSDKGTFNAGEMAAKEAESDALKRAAMKFGRSLGLALYDKSQEYVDEEQEIKVPVRASSGSNNKDVVDTKPSVKASPNIHALKAQIKQAYVVLKAQKKITKEDFVKDYSNDVKVDDIADEEIIKIIAKLKVNYPQLGL